MTTMDGDGGDGFPEDLVLDERFVNAAPIRELTAADRERRARRLAEQARAEAEDVARREQAAKQQRRDQRPHRRALSRLRGPGRLKGLLIVVAFFAVFGWLWTTDEADSEIGFEGWESGEVAASAYAADEPRPTPSLNDATSPLGRAAPPPRGGTYEFIEVQDDSSGPVAYDPCRVIPIVVNERTMPPDAEGLLEEALAATSEATGLQFRVEDTTDEKPDDERPVFQPERYGDRWAPVLFAWSDDDEYEPFKGNVAGTGGSTWVQTEDGTLVYITGSVTIDGPYLKAILATESALGGRDAARALLLHELAHLVGLDHVDDSRSIMHPEAGAVVAFQAGDLRGLAELGDGACVPAL